MNIIDYLEYTTYRISIVFEMRTSVIYWRKEFKKIIKFLSEFQAKNKYLICISKATKLLNQMF